jgi:outer membrane protein assembly factor BamB
MVAIMFDPTQGEQAARESLRDPALSAADLMTIAGAFPALAPDVAAHPALYPALADWLRELHSSKVDAALAARAPASAPTGAALETAGDAPSGPALQAVPSQDVPCQPAPAQDDPAPIGQEPAASAPHRRKSRKRLWISLAVAVVVVALSATAAGLLALREGRFGHSDQGMFAPDLVAKPELAAKLVAQDLLEGDFEQVSFAAFNASAELVAIYGQPDFANATQSDRTALTVVATSTGEPVWDEPIDIGQATGYEVSFMNSIHFASSDAVVAEFREYSGAASAGSKLASISTTGEIVGTTEVGQAWTVVGETVVIRTEDDRLSIRSPSQIDREIWGAEAAGGGSFDSPIQPAAYDGWLRLLVGPEDAHYVLTAAGYRDLADGAELGWGEPDPEIDYVATTGGIILRGKIDSDEDRWLIMRVDPASGQDLWESALESDTFGVYGADHGIILVETGEGQELSAVDADSGQEGWSVVLDADQPLTDAGFTRDGRTLVVTGDADMQAAAVKLIGRDGAESTSIATAADGVQTGPRVLYSLRSTALTAYDLDHDGAELWTLRLPADYGFAAFEQTAVVGSAQEIQLLVKK